MKKVDPGYFFFGNLYIDRSLRVLGVVHSDFDSGCTRDGMFGFGGFSNDHGSYQIRLAQYLKIFPQIQQFFPKIHEFEGSFGNGQDRVSNRGAQRKSGYHGP